MFTLYILKLKICLFFTDKWAYCEFNIKKIKRFYFKRACNNWAKNNSIDFKYDWRKYKKQHNRSNIIQLFNITNPEYDTSDFQILFSGFAIFENIITFNKSLIRKSSLEFDDKNRFTNMTYEIIYMLLNNQYSIPEIRLRLKSDHKFHKPLYILWRHNTGPPMLAIVDMLNSKSLINASHFLSLMSLFNNKESINMSNIYSAAKIEYQI